MWWALRLFGHDSMIDQENGSRRHDSTNPKGSPITHANCLANLSCDM